MENQNFSAVLNKTLPLSVKFTIYICSGLIALAAVGYLSLNIFWSIYEGGLAFDQGAFAFGTVALLIWVAAASPQIFLTVFVILFLYFSFKKKA